LSQHLKSIQSLASKKFLAIEIAIESDSRSAGDEHTVAQTNPIHSGPTTIPTTVARVVAVHEFPALPIQVLAAPIQTPEARVMSVDEYIRLPSQPDSSPTALA